MWALQRQFGAGVIAFFLGSASAGAADETVAEPAPPAIRLNTVGYLPGRPMAATVAKETGKFQVRRLADGAVVWEGELSCPPRVNVDTGEELSTADFSALGAAQAGDYELIVAASGERVQFRIAADLYRDPFRLATRAMYLWRCGTPVHGEHAANTSSMAPVAWRRELLDLVGQPGMHGGR